MGKYKALKKYVPSVQKAPGAEGVVPEAFVEAEESLEPSQASRPRSPLPTGAVDRGLMKPGWEERVEKLRAARAARGPNVPERAKVAPSWWERLWAPFDVFREPVGRPRLPTVALKDVIIPQAELEYVRRKREEFQRGAQPSYSRYGAERPSYAEPISRSERPRYTRPGAEPAYGPSFRQGPSRTPNLADLVTPAYVDQVLDTAKVFEHVRGLRKDPGFDGSAGIGVIAPAGIDPWGKVLETVRFFGIPEEAYQGVPRQEVWDRVIAPFLGAVITGLNNLKPADLPGTFVFGTSGRGAFGLIYTEAAKK